MAQANNTVLISTCIVSVALIISAIAIAYPKQSDYITVGGQAQALINPDGAAVYFTINSLRDTAEAAQTADADATKEVTRALQGLDPTMSIETTSFYLNRRMEWTAEGAIEKGYDVVHSFKVGTSIAHTDEVISAAVGAGANGVDRIEYTFSGSAKDEAVTRALTRAAIAAQAKANTVAESLGGSAGRPLKIEEGSWWVTPSDDGSLDELDIPAAYADSAIIPQRLAVQATVNAVFVLH